MPREPEPQQARELLRAADAELERRGAPRRSLCPEERLATPLAALGVRLSAELPIGAELAFAEALSAIALAELGSFPGNLFWDLDFLAASLARQAAVAAEPTRHLQRVAEEVVALQRVFGGEEIHFRYAHDFIYGYDWAKWVKKAPAERAHVGPFELPFLRALRRRGDELLHLICVNDAEYPKLTERDPDGALEPRNPFGFAREPWAEEQLHRLLAAEGAIPVESWRLDARPVWDRPYQELRVERALSLGLARK
ncbi:MAG: ferrochelatase [Polyangiaceae bacterium]|nr:ferrochelatase [Polyangiaceae bacterium]